MSNRFKQIIAATMMEFQAAEDRVRAQFQPDLNPQPDLDRALRENPEESVPPEKQKALQETLTARMAVAACYAALGMRIMQYLPLHMHVVVHEIGHKICGALQQGLPLETIWVSEDKRS